MSLNQYMNLGEDIVERPAWGMDLCTVLNLNALKPKGIPADLFHQFLERRLMFAIHQQGEEGYDIRKALQFIISSDPEYPHDADIDEDHL